MQKALNGRANMLPNDYYGKNFQWFVGVVEDHFDDSYVRVRIFGVHPFHNKELVPTDQLPLALVTYPVTGSQVTNGTIAHNLVVDSWVVGFFVDPPYCQQPIILSVINGTDYAASSQKEGGGAFVEQGSGASFPADPFGGGGNLGGDISSPADPFGGGSGGSDLSGTAPISIPGGSNIEKTYNFVVSKLQAEGGSSDPHLHASAVCGVLMLETPNINPAVVGGYKGRAWGICQWLGTRRTQLFQKYGHTKNLADQLNFMWWELNNTEKRAKSLWLRGQNLPDAVAGFCMFERAEEVKNGKVIRTHGNFQKRLKYAYQVYNTKKKTSNGAVA